MNSKKAGNLGRGLLSRSNHLHGFLALAEVELRRPTTYPTFSPRSLHPCPSPLSDHRSLELREAPDHLHHHSTCRGRRVDGLGETPKACLGGIDLLQDVQEVLQGPRQPVELPNHNDVAGTKLVKKAMKLRSVPSTAGRLFLKHSVGTSLLEGTGLHPCRLLLALRDPGVAEEVPLWLLGLAQTHCERVCQRNTVLQRASH